MAKMYPENIEIYYDATDSEKEVFYALKTQLLPDKDYEVFYSVKWQRKKGNRIEKSEADFIVTSPKYGILILEVKGGSDMIIEAGKWHLIDNKGGRDLDESPYDQAERSMYYFTKTFENVNHLKYPGLYAAGAVFPYYNLNDDIISTISDRNRECTIMFSDMSSIGEKVKRMFKMWSGNTFGHRLYSKQSHEAMVELIKKRVAISAAAGALVEVKARELLTINRVQDNYVFFLSNVRQFYIRGGAGTGKTWIAIKFANYECKSGKKTMFVCASKPLADMVKTHVEPEVDVYDIKTLFGEIIEDFGSYEAPLYKGIADCIREDLPKYEAIFIDEAQDFTEEWAYIVKMMLLNEKQSRLGVFYDDVQIVRESSFGDAFMIDSEPFLLNENIRNTSNIYNWATSSTNLGKDVITNPVEGPVPMKEIINDKRHLTQRLENLLKEYLEDEALKPSSLVILVLDKDEFLERYKDGLAKWYFTGDVECESEKIRVSTPEEYKGLEADMVIYIHNDSSSDNLDYIAYTRAKYYLIELIQR